MQAISEERIRKALAQIIHPEIEGRNLVELGMIKGIAIHAGQVEVALALPFKEVPVKDDLIRSIENTLEGLCEGLNVRVTTSEMSQRERAIFMSFSQGISSEEDKPDNDITHVVAVMSGKGGVGKSSVAGMLAVALRRQGYEVGVLDADITGPSIPMMFGVHQHPIGGPQGIMPVETETGIKVMSINLLLQSEDQAVIWRGPLISRAIQQFWGDITWGRLDYLVVDLPPGTSDAALTVMQSIPLTGIVLVTSPQDLAGMIVRKAAGLAQQMGAPILGIVENMSYAICPQCDARIDVFGPSSAARTAQVIGAPLIGQLPLDPELATRCDAGEIEDYRASLFEPIARKVTERTRAELARIRDD